MIPIVEQLEKIINDLQNLLNRLKKPPTKALTRDEISFEGED